MIVMKLGVGVTGHINPSYTDHYNNLSLIPLFRIKPTTLTLKDLTLWGLCWTIGPERITCTILGFLGCHSKKDLRLLAGVGARPAEGPDP